jgi:septal ring factor EnvC (AmiA/AmiB activator)
MPQNKNKSKGKSNQINNQPMTSNSPNTQPENTCLNQSNTNQQPVISQTFQGSIHCSIIPTHEYQALLNENQALKQEILILKGNADQLRQQNQNQAIEIEILRKENTQLKKELAELKKELAELKKEFAEFKDKFSNYKKLTEDDKMMAKVIFALQDLNSYDQLEQRGNPFKPL